LWLVLILLILSFTEQICNFIEVHNIFFMDCISGVYLQCYHYTHIHLGFLLLPSRGFIVLCFTFKSLIHFECVCVCVCVCVGCKRCRHFLCMSSWSTTFLEKTVPVPLNDLCCFILYQRLVDCIYVGLFLNSLLHR
jgi:hypothetical protein